MFVHQTFEEIAILASIVVISAVINGFLEKEIAHSCGYESASMFSVWFKEQFGETPGKFRNS